jgi:predicted transcriptional regulator
VSSTDTDRILAWLTRHQGSTVKEIAAATGLGSQYVSARLKGAVMAGRARQDREHGAAPWQWSALAPRRAVR